MYKPRVQSRALDQVRATQFSVGTRGVTMKCVDCGKETGAEWKTRCLDCFSKQKETERGGKYNPEDKSFTPPHFSSCKLESVLCADNTAVQDAYNSFGAKHVIKATQILPCNGGFALFMYYLC